MSTNRNNANRKGRNSVPPWVGAWFRRLNGITLSLEASYRELKAQGKKQDETLAELKEMNRKHDERHAKYDERHAKYDEDMKKIARATSVNTRAILKLLAERGR